MWKRICSSASLSSKTSKTKTNELDRCKHRCKSVNSLLSLENSFITADTDNTAGGEDVGDIIVNRNNRDYFCNRATNRSFDDDNDSGNNIGLNIDDDDVDDSSTVCNDDDDDDEAKELEDFQGKLILLINDGAKNGDKANVTTTASDPKPKLFLLGKISPLRIIPPFTPKPVTSSTSTEKATMEGTITKSTSTNSILKTEKSSSSLLTRSNSAVRFGSIEIHEHEIVLGNSVPSTGPPLTLAWERLSYHKINSIDDHHRQQQQQQNSIRPQPAQERINRLLERGYTLRAIRSSIREAGKERIKRRSSIREAGKERTKRIQSLRKPSMCKGGLDMKQVFSRLFTRCSKSSSSSSKNDNTSP